MCGIVGFFSPSGKRTPNDLRLMTDAIRHRGPDASGFYFNEDSTVGLGHRRLSIIDLSAAANQPIYSHCGRYVIVFNGEIYNYREIAAELHVKPKTTSDTEVLIEAFAQWGEGFVHRLNGMFAFAIYDIKNETLYIYKDRIGIKPLFYFHQGNEFYFASELKAFRQLPNFEPGGVSATALQSFLYLGYIPTPHTIFNHIRKLGAGSYVVINKNDTHFKTYWTLDEQIEAQTLSNLTAAKKQLQELLQSAVSYRMISDVPFGTFLSGGIDSSLVTAVAQNNASTPINTFTIGFEEEGMSEVEYARKVSKHLGTQHHEMICSYSLALEMFDGIFDVYDEPFADPSMFPTILVSKFSRKHVTMILSGDGGDETYFGYGFYNWGNRMSKPFIHPFRKLISAGLAAMPDSRFKRASKMFQYQSVDRLKSHIFSQEQYWFMESEILTMLNAPKFLVDVNERVETNQRKLTINEEQAIFDLRYYMHDDLLVKVDRASMLHALEVRVPLLDYRLVKFAMNLHPAIRKKGNTSKFLLKEILYEMVPREYFERPKWGFGVPVGRWLKKEWKHLIDDYLNEQTVKATGLLNYEEVQNLLKRYGAGEDYLYYRIWLLILIQKWLTENRLTA